jgi:hypothetical protein
VDREVGHEADAQRVFAQQLRAHAVERPRPGQDGRGVVRAAAQLRLQYHARAPRQLGGRPPAEGEQQQALRIGAVPHQMRDAMRERAGLAGARPRDDQQRRRRGAPRAVFDGFLLGAVERGKGETHGRERRGAVVERSFDELYPARPALG